MGKKGFVCGDPFLKSLFLSISLTRFCLVFQFLEIYSYFISLMSREEIQLSWTFFPRVKLQLAYEINNSEQIFLRVDLSQSYRIW